MSYIKPTHTPGPWDAIIRQNNEGIIGYIGAHGDHRVLVKVPCSTPEGEANARLVAHCPDLLEALCAVTEALESRLEEAGIDPSDSPDVQQSRAALTKALGLCQEDK